ncbi:MAG TPA: glycogen-binding domain-containing protein [Longimicrobiales bacterium]|nr:glycogen-binding domain-containing protein [Longimicrobiales bacterium]
MRLTIFVACATAAVPAAAQQWKLSMQAGEMRSTLDPANASTSIALGLGYEASNVGFRLSAGLPTSSVESLWAGAGAWTRAALHHDGLVAGVDLSGNAFITRDRSAQSGPERPPFIPDPFDPPLEAVADRSGYALAGQALPVLGYEGSMLQLHARAGVSLYRASFGELATDRTVRLADLRLTLLPASSLALMPVVRRYVPEGWDAATYAGASALIAHRLGSVWGSAGHWLESEDAGLPWSVGASLRVHTRATIDAGARHDTFDPLYMQPPQTSWNVGLSLQIGGPVGAPAPPVPAEYTDGRATIQLPVSMSADVPRIAGDFNDWTPVPMQRTGDNWTYTIALEPGVYNYSFVNADGRWFVPEEVPGRRDDGMGGHVAVLIVE